MFSLNMLKKLLSRNWYKLVKKCLFNCQQQSIKMSEPNAVELIIYYFVVDDMDYKTDYKRE